MPGFVLPSSPMSSSSVCGSLKQPLWQPNSGQKVWHVANFVSPNRRTASATERQRRRCVILAAGAGVFKHLRGTQALISSGPVPDTFIPPEFLGPAELAAPPETALDFGPAPGPDYSWAGHPGAGCSTLARRASEGSSLPLPRLRFGLVFGHE